MGLFFTEDAEQSLGATSFVKKAYYEELFRSVPAGAVVRTSPDGTCAAIIQHPEPDDFSSMQNAVTDFRSLRDALVAKTAD